ncbi:MAG: ATP-binding protein [Elusimicrobiota bacterium]
MKLFHRFFLILLAFSTLPVVGMGVLMLSSRGAVQDNARLLHKRLAALTADSAERTIEQLNRALAVVADLEVSRGRKSLDLTILQHAAAGDSNVALIAILDASGVEVYRSADPDLFPDAALRERSDDPAVIQCLRTRHLALGAVVTVREQSLLPAAHPLTDGRLLYMLYSLKGLQRRLGRMPKGGRGRILLVDEAGRPLSGVGDAPPAKDWTLPAGDGEGWSDRLPSSDGPLVAASVRLQSPPWSAVSLQPRRDAYAESDAAASQAVALFLALCLIVTGAAYLLSQRLLTPIAALVAGAERVAQGDFAHLIPGLGWGELDRLGKTFNAMTEKVRHYQGIQVDRLLAEKAKVDALVSNIPDGVLMAGFDGSIIFVNATAARVLALRGPISRVSEITALPEIRHLVDSVKAGAKRVEGVIVETTLQEGRPSAVFACQALSVARQGRDEGILVLMRDVTIQRELERMKDEFFHSVVHDLRGPISIIDGMVYFLKKLQGLDERQRKYVDLAEQASKRLSELVANILDIAKLESGTMTLALSKFSSAAFLGTLRDLYRLPAESKGVSIELEAGDAGELTGDMKLLERVVMNLVGNALKFTPAGGRILLGAAGSGAEVEFFVRDTGPGIPADKLEAVFEKFKQLDSDAAARAGYGLGLSICKKVVELHRGRIWVESKDGAGSRFAFRIPRNTNP